MNLSDSVISSDYFFITGINALLTSKLIDESYYIVDVETASLAQIKNCFGSSKKVIAFITNDLDYYALRGMQNVIIIDKCSQLNGILLSLFVNDSRYAYQVKYQLTTREREVLLCMQKGLHMNRILEHLGITAKTFYSHRRSLMFKLQAGNRISLFRNIKRVEAYKQNIYKYSHWE